MQSAVFSGRQSTFRWLVLSVVLCALLSVSLSCTSGYRPQIAARPSLNEADLSALAYESLANRAGVVIVIDPRYGRILKRVSRGTEVRFSASPFELAQLVTAYAALDAGIINAQSLQLCREQGRQINVSEALSHSCPSFFTELSRRITPEQFVRAAGVIGFIYYGAESPTWDQTLVRPVAADIPTELSADQFAALASRGEGMTAEDLHLAALAAALASGTTASERFAAYIMINAKAVAPPVVSFNRQALAVIQGGLRRAVDEGEARAAAHIEHRVAAKIGGRDGQAISISWVPAQDPQLALVVYLKDAVARDAAEVAGKFYEYWYRK